MKFEIKEKTWQRYDLFWYYINNLRCVMSMTCDIDITDFLSYIKEREYRFYPCFIWAVTKIVNNHSEFKLGWDENNQIGEYDIIHPYFAHFYKDDENFVKLVTEYDDDLSIFHTDFVQTIKKYKDYRNFDLKKIPANTFDVSCLPWIDYKNFDIHVFDEGKYLAPVVTWGKYTESGGKVIIPLSFNIHHAAADGYHLSRFFVELRELMKSYENYT